MKVAIVLVAFLGMSLAQHHGMGDLIHKEVGAILAADSTLTVDGCTTKCDALFDLIDAGDEQRTDEMCKHECDCQINKTCDINHTHPTHHPHPTHPTHHPHPTHPDHP